VVGKEVVVVAARPGSYQLDPAVAWNGRVYLVVWQEVTPFVEGSQIYGARVSAGGKVLDPGGILLSPDDPNPNRNPRVAAGNGRFLVVWEEDRSPTDIRGALVSGTGSVLKQWFVSSGEDAQLTPDLAWNGTQFFVAWSDQVDGEPFDIYGTRVRWSGRTLDGCSSDGCADDLGHGISVNASAPGDQFEPAVTAIRSGPDAGLFLLTWTDEVVPADHDLRGGRLTGAGTPLDGTGFLVSGAAGGQSQSALAVSGTTALDVWTDHRSGPRADIFAARFSPTARAGDTPAPVPPQGSDVSRAAGDQDDPSVALRGTGFVTAWTDSRSGTTDIFAARIGPGGAILDPAGLPIAATPRNEETAALATGGPKLLVAYSRDTVAPRFAGGSRVFLRLVGGLG